MNKNIFYNVSLTIGSLLIFGLAFEVILRTIHYNPFGEFFKNEGPAVFIQPSKNPQRIFEAKPDSHGKGWGTEVTINRYGFKNNGFRGHEYTIKKPDNVYRIVVIGDSIAFGNNLPPDKNYPALLEQRYTDAHQSVEVLNLSLGGYDTLQEVATLEEIGLPFSPDLVVLGYCINDIGVASGNLNYIKRLKNYGGPIYRSRLAQFIRVQLDRVELIEYSKSANTKESFDSIYNNSQADISGDTELSEKIQRLSDLLNTSVDEKNARYFFTRDYAQTNRIQRLRFGLEKLKALQEKNSFDVVVLFTPYLLEDKASQPIYQAVYAIIEHEVTRLDFSVLNFYQHFVTAGFNNVILKKNDGVHPNQLGHEIIAEELFKRVKQ